LSGPRGIIRQTEFFLYSEKDREAVRVCQEKGYPFPEITAWIRAVEKDFELVKKMGIRETGILTSCSDYPIHLKLGMNRKQAMEQYLSVVKAALDAGIRPDAISKISPEPICTASSSRSLRRWSACPKKAGFPLRCACAIRWGTAKLLNRPLGVLVTDKAGTAGVAHWVNRQLGLTGPGAIDKRHPGVQEMYAWVLKQYEDGRTTSLSDEELLEAARRHLPAWFEADR